MGNFLYLGNILSCHLFFLFFFTFIFVVSLCQSSIRVPLLLVSSLKKKKKESVLGIYQQRHVIGNSRFSLTHSCYLMTELCICEFLQLLQPDCSQCTLSSSTFYSLLYLCIFSCRFFLVLHYHSVVSWHIFSPLQRIIGSVIHSGLCDFGCCGRLAASESCSCRATFCFLLYHIQPSLHLAALSYMLWFEVEMSPGFT